MATTYPVRVHARLDEPLSRWLWLVKWLLVIPHVIVLAFLWAAFVVLSLVAFFAILFTGRYPRAIFDFNVGVLRWSWRVAYYTYGALGTDRYPPFTLRRVPDYPADLEVAYPEHLSRGLVLVKTWLLAIPHYLVVGLFSGAAWATWRAGDRIVSTGSGGLIGVLVLVAAVVLLVSGRYPRPIFDLILGMNRWGLRVAAYAGLMTDEYPPFRLDMGGDESGPVLTVPTPPPAGLGPVPPRSGWTPGRVTWVVLGSLLLVASLGLTAAGGAGLWVDRADRGADGYVSLGSQTYASDGYALVSERLHIGSGATGLVQGLIGNVRVRATATNRGEALFLGLAKRSSSDAYLDRVAYTSIRGLGSGVAGQVEHSGGPLPVPPAAAPIWSQQSAGPGERTIVWTPSDGEWRLLVLNSDGTPGLSVRAELAAELPALGYLATAALVLGLLGAAVGSVLVALPISRSDSCAAHPGPTGDLRRSKEDVMTTYDGATDQARQQARKRLQNKRDFMSDLVAYVVINAFLVGVWAMTGSGYFWPAWVLAGWGIGLVMHAYDAFVRRPITEADVDRELNRQR